MSLSSDQDDEFNTSQNNSTPSKPIERKYWLRPLIFLMAIVGLAIGASRLPVGYQLRGNQGNGGSGAKNTSSSTTAAPTAAPTTLFDKRRSTVEYLVISPTLENPEVLLDSNTPQGRAFEEIIAESLDNSFRIIQRFALMTLYYSTEGQNWSLGSGPDVFSLKEFGPMSKGWTLFSPNECSWYGVKCKKENDGEAVVTSIKLDGNSLDGILPSEICLLGSLEILTLSDNMLHGILPSCIFGLQNMIEIDLSRNQLQGNLNDLFSGIPKNQTAAMGNLKRLNLDNNKFSGQVPKQLPSIPSLSEMTLHGNDLTGSILMTCGMEKLTADCAEVDCDCCTECF